MIPQTVTCNHLESCPKNLPEEIPSSPLLAWFPPIVQDLYLRNEANRHLLDPILLLLEHAMTQLTLHVGPGICPLSSTPGSPQPLSPYKTPDKPVLTTGNIQLLIQLSYYRCPKCGYRSDEQPDLTLPGGLYDRGLILNGVALYTCGCSYEHTRGLLTSQFDISPALSTVQNWVQHVGSTAHQLNRATLAPVQVKEIAIDEIFTAVRDGQTAATHTPMFSTVLQEAQFGTILHIGVSEGYSGA